MDLAACRKNRGSVKGVMILFRENTIVSIIKAGVYAALFLPLVVIPLFFFPFSASRGFLFQIIIEATFALYAVLAIRNPAYRPKKSLILFAFAAYIAALVLSAILGLDPYRSIFGNYERMWGVFQLSHFFLFFLVCAGMFKTKKDWDGVVKVAVGVGFLSALAALAHFLFVWMSTGNMPRAFGLVGNPAFLAGYLLFPVFFAIPYFIDAMHARPKPLAKEGLFAIGTVLSVAGIVSTGTRGALLALVGAGFLGAALLAVFAKTKAIKYPAIAALAAAVLGVGILFASADRLFEKPVRVSQETFYSPDHFDAPAKEGGTIFSRITNFSFYDVTTQTRLIAWRSALSEMKAHPIFGVGPENFILAFNKKFDPAFYTYERSEIWFDHAHNAFIDVLVSEGIVGLLAYISLFLAALWLIVSHYRKGVLGGAPALAFALFFVAYALQNAFLFDTFTGFLMLVVALAYLHGISENSAKTEQGRVITSQMFVVPLVGVLVLAYLFTYKPAMEGYYLSQAESGRYDISGAMEQYRKALAYQTFGDNETRSRMALAVARYVQGLPEGQLSPQADAYLNEAMGALKANIDTSNQHHLLFRLQLSDLYNLKLSRTGQSSPEIEDIIKKSIEISPGRMEFEFALAQAEFLKGEYQKSIDILMHASAKNPDHPIPYWKMSQAYHFKGDDANAITYLEKALYLGHSARDVREILWAEKYYVDHQDLAKVIYIDRRMLGMGVDIKEQIRLHMNMAVAYATLGNKEKAKEHAEAIAQLDPSQNEAVDGFINAL